MLACSLSLRLCNSYKKFWIMVYSYKHLPLSSLIRFLATLTSFFITENIESISTGTVISSISIYTFLSAFMITFTFINICGMEVISTESILLFSLSDCTQIIIIGRRCESIEISNK